MVAIKDSFSQDELVIAKIIKDNANKIILTRCKSAFDVLNTVIQKITVNGEEDWSRLSIQDVKEVLAKLSISSLSLHFESIDAEIESEIAEYLMKEKIEKASLVATGTQKEKENFALQTAKEDRLFFLMKNEVKRALFRTLERFDKICDRVTRISKLMELEINNSLGGE